MQYCRFAQHGVKRCAPPAAPLGLRPNPYQLMLAFFKPMPNKTIGCSGYGTCRFAARRLRQERYMQCQATYNLRRPSWPPFL